jgi:DNA uptake protein ComE-like DNA-binding protein
MRNKFFRWLFTILSAILALYLSSQLSHYYDEKVRPAPSASQSTDIVIYISGAVVHPGVYNLPSGSRISDAVNKAGGLRPEADPESVNQTLPASDLMHIVIAEQKKFPSLSR